MFRIPRAFPLLAFSLWALACRADEARELVLGDAARGFRLVEDLGCASCHPAAGVALEPAPRLDRAGARLTPEGIAAALEGGPRMPAVAMADGERDALVHFLAALGGPLASEPLAVDALTVERGRQLYHSIGCVACHAPFERAETLDRPIWEFEDSYEARAAVATPSEDRRRDPRDLLGLAARTTRAALAIYLRDPLAVHPSGRMPSLGLSAGEAADVAAYLFYEDAASMGATLAPGAGLLLDYHEGSFPDDTVDFDALVPVRTEVATSWFDGIARREDDFGFRFRGLIEIAAEGMYRFTTTSDDGSMLYVDGGLVVDNRGQHAMSARSGEVHLAPGRHALEVTYFEHLGGDGLEVTWSGPGFAERELGFDVLSHLQVSAPPLGETSVALDPALVARGAELYTALGCASCHDGAEPRGAPLAELDPRRGCLDGRDPHPVLYALAPADRADLGAAVAAGAPPPIDTDARLARELERLDCHACHARDGRGGPEGDARSFFRVAGDLDLGDQGRFPPALDRAGAKLKPDWFRAVLAGARARPYMQTRMPRFGAAVEALPGLFADADAHLRAEREPEFRVEDVEAGRLLAGTKGLGCIQCHDFAGHPSIGIPAVDLAHVHERIWPGWFRELLMDPVAIQMNTRMPAFWVDGRSPVKDVCGGDPAAQVDALWTYLALGSSMPLPHGLVPRPREYEVEVFDEPVCVGVFMEGVSPRTVCVGLPERVHYAFDVQNSRLALAWRGRFLDARGTWHARAGQLEKPAGEDVIEFPEGPTFAVLAEEGDPWPDAKALTASHRVLGRSTDEGGRPKFRYELDGGVRIAEAMSARVRPGGGSLTRAFWVNRYDTDAGVVARLAVGSEIRQVDESTWRVSTDGRDVDVRSDRPYEIIVVRTPESVELRASLRGWGVGHFSGPEGRTAVGWSNFEVEYSW